MNKQAQIAFVLERKDKARLYGVVATIANNDGYLSEEQVENLKTAISEQLRATLDVKFGIVAVEATVNYVFLTPEKEANIEWQQ